MSKPYRPSNSSEGDAFESKTCKYCCHYVNETCNKEIIFSAMAHEIGDDDYPPELIINPITGWPTCTERKAQPPRKPKTQDSSDWGLF